MTNRVSLCMIVRDEADYLPQCLESVQGIVDEIVIVDTGSRDATVEIARRYGAIIKEIAWPNDFAAARNEALTLATGEWILSLDADETLAPESRSMLLSLVADRTVDGYFVNIQNLMGAAATGEFSVEMATAFRLWRNRPLYRFVGSVHEQILPVIKAVNADAAIAPSSLTIIHVGYLSETVMAKGKQDRNVRLLEAEVANHPDNYFQRFNLGGEYFLRREFHKARTTLHTTLAKSPPDASWRAPAVKYYAATLAELGRWDDVLSFLSDELPRYPDFTDLTYTTGAAYRSLQHFDQAIAAFTQCIRQGPAPCPPYWPVDPELGACKAYLALGNSYEAAQQHPQALEAYAKAAMHKRGWMEPLKRLTSLMTREVADHTTLRVLEAFFPGDGAKERVSIATLLAHAGRHALALQHLAPLIESDALDYGGKFTHAYALAKAGRCEEALAICGDGWEGTAFEPQIGALALYCRVRLTHATADLALPIHDKEALRQLYADLAAILAGEPPEVTAQFIQRLPKSKLLRLRGM